MRISKLKKLLNLWEMNELISKEQNQSISDFMKERQKENFFRFLKWLSVIGAAWIVIGIIITIINIFELDFMQYFAKLFISTFEFFYKLFIEPFNNFIFNIFGENNVYFYWSLLALCCFGIFTYLSIKYKSDNSINKLNLSDEQKNILKTNFVYDALSAFSLSSVFCLWNMLLIPHDAYISTAKIFPFWNLVGAITFIVLAYKYLKNLYLLFGIYFVALTVGMFHGYDFACYWIGVSRPVVQIFVSIILLLVGYITELKYTNNFIKEKFASTYNWTGLFMLFIALWITSIWGFGFDSYSTSSALELWLANILFIVAAIGAMYYGTKFEHKIFFNYGLVFLIIETYTVFCLRLWKYFPVGIASLILGIIMLSTVKILKNTYIKNNK